MNQTIVLTENNKETLTETLEYTHDTLHAQLDVDEIINHTDFSGHADKTKYRLTEHIVHVLTIDDSLNEDAQAVLDQGLRDNNTTDIVINKTDAQDVIKTAHENDTNSHDVSTAVVITRRADGDLVNDLLETIHDHETDTETWTGRPPHGFSVEDGQLVKNDEFDDIKHTLKRVADDEVTKTEAADRIGCTRKTVNTCLTHASRYELD